MISESPGTKELSRRAMLRLPAALLPLLYGCRGSAEIPPVFPETVAGVWRRSSLREAAASEAPDSVPAQSIRRLQLAEYEGPGKLRARIYALTSSGAALDVVQRWRPSADTVFFHQGEYVVAISWQDADRKSVREFVHAVEGRLAPPGQKRDASRAE